MRVLLVGNYPPPFGGISVHVQLLQRLLQQQGHDCLVLNVDPRAPLSSNYIKINGQRDLVPRLITASRGRIVHTHISGHNLKSWLVALVTGWLGRIWGRGAMLTIHSGLLPQYLDSCGCYLRWIIKLALHAQASVYCVNREIITAVKALGCQRTVLMPAFLFDESALLPVDAALTERLKAFHPVITTVAFFRPEYGLELLISALGELAKQYPAIGCVIIGSGNDKAQLQQLAARTGVAERLLWLGDIEHGLCLSMIRNSDLFVRPTLADGDAISVREALRLGVPVVASDVGHRPHQAILFKCGDVKDLVDKCVAALSARTVSSHIIQPCQLIPGSARL